MGVLSDIINNAPDREEAIRQWNATIKEIEQIEVIYVEI